MTPKEFQKSNLAVELKAGKKRLEDALRGLSDEQCERTGATRSGSLVDLLSEIVAKEFLATDWEIVFGGTYSTGIPVRRRTVRAWKSRKVIAERIEALPSLKPRFTKPFPPRSPC